MLFSFHCPACKGKLEADASLSGTQAECPECGKPVAIPEGRVDAGTTLAGFQLERRLGKGGMGEVYLARQLSVDREVAVKILPPGFAADRDAVQRFLHEGRLAAKLDHHHIATIYEAGEDSGNYYLAMAYIEGESLDQRLKRDKALPEAEALGIVRAVADALAYAWEEFQLLHRDIKPANIMVDRRGRVFLMDLGLAKSLGEETGLTLSGTILGTPQYMSPEQALGHSDLGMATDIYSLGATLYHLVTGAPPFTGDSVLKILNQHVHEPLPPPRERNPQVSKVCNRLIEIMMAKKPEDRYGDWRALLADLDRILAHDGSVAPGQSLLGERPVAAPVPVQPPAAPQKSLARQAQEALARQREAQAKTPPKATPATAQPSRRRVSPWMLALAAVGVVLLVLVVALALRGRGRTPVADAASSPLLTPVSPTSPTGPTVPAVTIPAQGLPWTMPDLGMEFVYVAPGSFRMGSDAGDATEKPVHEVRITRSYWLGKYEVTQAEYEAVMGENPSQFRGARNPAEFLSWDDAVAFCRKLTERERSAGRLPDGGYVYRLPTEAEWEYAALGGVRSKGFSHAGSNSPDEVAWYDENGDSKTHPVGQKKPNELGLYDMSGNVWERCHDWYGSYQAGTVTDPTGPDAGQFRMFRGGSWRHPAQSCRSARRYGDKPARLFSDLGLRVALATPVATPSPPSPVSVVSSSVRPLVPAEGQPWTVPGLGMAFVYVEPGSFRMGSDTGEADERPVHEVRITRGFWLGKHEVTQAEYEATMGKNPAHFRGASNPVEGVSWNDAAAFCSKLTGRERAAGRLPSGYEYRLPTEAEWEYAARGGTRSQGFTYAGSNSIDEVAWYGDSKKGRPHPGGQKKPNELGLCDMIGNVWEHCHDRYGNYPAGMVTDPSGPDAGLDRVGRGGAFSYYAGGCRAASRGKNTPSSSFSCVGFRVALAAPVSAIPSSSLASSAPAPTSAVPAATPGWQTLFDGKGLDAWQVVGSWTVQDGLLLAPGNEVCELWTKQTYGDYELGLEFRLEPGSNSGIYLNDSTTGIANQAKRGIEVQLIDEASVANLSDTSLCGSIFNRLTRKLAAAKAVGEWNRLTVTCRGPRVVVVMNGQTIIDDDVLTAAEVRALQAAKAAGTKLGENDLPPGHIGLQKHTGVAQFRNVRIRGL